MTLMEMLKQVFGSKIDEEIELDNNVNTGDNKGETSNNEQSTVVENPEESKLETETGDTKGETPDKVGDQVNDNKDTVSEGGDNVVIFEDGWFNAETGVVDESKIKNPEALAAIKYLTSKYQAEKDQRVIADSLNDELKNYSLAVSEETLRKVLDMSKVTIGKDGKATGIKEALEALKTSEPGFFKDKEKESNPLNEGFNPVEKKNTDNISSFAQAFSLMEEIN